uniref:Capsid protein n=1 Tax=Plant associated genomovirus 23 TaxID=2584395 RepID=A0A4Y5QD59_9VIRU|nr:capsid protein [Plant associated genomovirus 23]
MPRYAKKTTTRRRKYVKKRTARKTKSGGTRKRTMTYKRIKAITAVKKRDHMIIGQHPPGDTEGTPSPFINQVMDGNISMYFFSPSYMPLQAAESKYGRTSNKVHHTSYAEKFEIEIGCDVSLLHRRLVFSNMYDDTRAICTRGDITLRNLTKVDPASFEDLFQGTKGVDWFDLFKVPMNRQKVTVMSDKLYTYTPKNPHGQAFPRKYYHKINKRYNFQDNERGTDEVTNGYNWPGIKSPKVFIFDIFKSFRDTRNSPAFPLGEQYWSLAIEATNYWTEEAQ